MRVLVFGGREFRDWERLRDCLNSLHLLTTITCIIEGEAEGADKLAKRWAEERNIPVDPYPAAWDDFSEPCVVRFTSTGKRYNAAAGGKRNQRMLDEGRPDCAVHFPGGKGTADMAQRVMRAGVKIIRG